MKYRKQEDGGPGLEIEAVQWDGNQFVGGAPTWMAEAINGKFSPSQKVGAVMRIGSELHIGGYGGRMLASPGDWVIRGAAGELHPCRNSAFIKIYEPLE